MRTSQLFFPTLKEIPQDAELISHQLMLRAGLIRKLGSGLYTWLPLGFKVLSKVANVVREEMEAVNAGEVLMPAVQPSALWEETGRWEKFGPQLLKITDRHGREFCYGPTHEEVITDLIRANTSSYKSFPMTLFQIQTKFRDEIRPRFGVMRAREFIMKDAYSFHLDATCLNNTYQAMHGAYTKIFTRLGLNFRPVLADTGAIGGSFSHEFHVLADSGEDAILYSKDGSYAANVETASALLPPASTEAIKALETVLSTKERTTAAQAAFFKVDEQRILKTLLVKGTTVPVVALCVRGDDNLNACKAEKHPLVANPLTLIEEADVVNLLNCQPGFVGPMGLTLPIVADHFTQQDVNMIIGANKTEHHHLNFNWSRDSKDVTFFDLREAKAGDLSIDGHGVLSECRGIEVGHIFQLGTNYSEKMKATILNENGETKPLVMGCYGIGVSRLVAAAIEQNNDEHGIIWPLEMAPYKVVIIGLGTDKSELVKTTAENLYNEFKAAGIDVLLEDRKTRPGVMFADMDLIGIPYQIVIGERSLKEGVLEFKHRRTGLKENIAQGSMFAHITALLSS